MGERDIALAPILGALSQATDMAAGQPPGAALSATVLATRLARAMGVAEADLAAVYYACVTRFIGCTSTSSDVADFTLGDELTAYYAYTLADPGDPASVRHFLESQYRPDAPAEARAEVIEACVAAGDDMMAAGLPHCEQAVALIGRMPLPDGIAPVLAHVEARWDGRNTAHPGGEDLPLATRIIEFAVVAELHRRAGGLRSMLELALARAGGQFDPEVCRIFAAGAPALIAGLGQGRDFEVYLAAEPEGPRQVGPDGLRAVALAFADFADMKSRWFLGHSRAVAGLAYRAAVAQGGEEEAAEAVFNAGLLHDIGKCAIRNGIWEKPGPLAPHEAAEMRTHSFHTEQVLAASPLFDPVRDIACSAHERADGSGFHRRTRLEDGRCALLAVANLYDELTADMPARPALAPGAAAEAVLAEVHAGRLPRAEARAVLDAAGHARAVSDRALPDGMTAREAEVLRHLARGLTTKEIARKLGVAPKTVDNHTQNLYRKIGAQSRTGAAMYAFAKGLFTL